MFYSNNKCLREVYNHPTMAMLRTGVSLLLFQFFLAVIYGVFEHSRLHLKVTVDWLQVPRRK